MDEDMTVSEFIAKYSKPYDPENDDYDVLAFNKNFDEVSKATDIHNMHIYWTKQNPYVISEFIRHYTKPGDIVLDAFCGTGMTGVSAKMTGRHCILSDISPTCIHIAKNILSPIDPEKFLDASRSLIEMAKKELGWLYKAKCHNCGNPNAEIENTLLSLVMKCPRCGETNIYASDDRWGDLKNGVKFKKFKCIGCHKEFTKAKASFLGFKEIAKRVHCDVCNLRAEEKETNITKDDEIIFEKLKNYEITDWFPSDVDLFGHQPMRDALHKHSIKKVYQMFSKRNLISLSYLWKKINDFSDKNLVKKLIFCFTSILFTSSLMCRWYHSTFTMTGMRTRKGTFMIPSIVNDVNVFRTFTSKSDDIYSGVKFGLNYFIYNSNVFIRKHNSISLYDIKDNSIDFIYYDPPYEDNINYSELNIMWESWLGEFTDVKSEIIQSRFDSSRNLDYYISKMEKAFSEAFRVLKPNRWMTLVYSSSDPQVWGELQRIIKKIGFISENDALFINSKSKTAIQQITKSTQQRYLVLNLKKPASVITNNIDLVVNDLSIHLKIIREYLQRVPGSTKDYIYDECIRKMFPSVKIEVFDLDRILSEGYSMGMFRKVGDKWYSTSTKFDFEGGDFLPLEFDGEERKFKDDDKETVRVLREFIEKHGKTGVSELRDHYSVETSKRKLNPKMEFKDMIDHTRGGFFKLDRDYVRLLTKEEEEEAKDLKGKITRRNIQRHIEGTLDFSPDDKQIAEWIEFAYEKSDKDRFMAQVVIKLFTPTLKEVVGEETFRKYQKWVKVCKMKG